jgi:AraC-like DNA-binding protein
MAEIACLSEFHFNRLFHKQFGLSPYAYYLVCKLKISQNILMEQKSVTGTAFDIGFFDQSHFTRLFKKHVGVTPGKYLRDNRIYEQIKPST